MGQALLGIGAGAAGAFGGAYDSAAANRQKRQMGDIDIQNAQRDAAALSALGQLGSGVQALPGIGGGQGGSPPGMPQPPMPQPGGAAIPRPGSSVMPSPGQQVYAGQNPMGMPGQQPPRPMQASFPGVPPPMPPEMVAGSSGGPPMPQMSAQAGMQAMAPGSQPRPTMPFPGPAASVGLPPGAAPGGGGPPSSSPPPPGGLRGREQLDPMLQGRGGMPQANTVRWDQAMQMIGRANPGIKPDVLMRATDMFMQKFGDKQNLMDWREQQIGWREQQIASRERMATEAAQMKFQLAGMTDERIRDIAQGNTDLKLRLENQREQARKEIVGQQLEAAQTRVETQEAGRGERLATTEAGKGERLATAEAGKEARQATGIAGKKEIVGEQIKAAGERQDKAIGAAADRQKAGIEAGQQKQQSSQDFAREQREAGERFRTEVQRRNIEAAATRQEKAIAAKASSGLKLSPQENESLATAIAEYRLPPYSSRASADAMKAMARAQQLNPAYDATVYGGKNDAMKKFASGTEGRTIRSLNVADLHLDTLTELQRALQNGKLTAANEIINRWKKASGFTAPVAFDLAKQTVASEVVKAVSGMSGGGQKERLEAAQNIANHLNDDQFDAAVAGLRDLLKGQKQGLRTQYEAATGLKDFDRFLFKKGVEEKSDVPAAGSTKGTIDGIPYEIRP